MAGAAEADGGGDANVVDASDAVGVAGLAAALSATVFVPPAGSRSRCDPSGTQ
jgi:hypothetical protein